MTAVEPQVSTGLPFDPSNPPARVFISGYTYKLAAPKFVRPPLPGTVKLVLNWSGVGGAVAHNIFYAQLSLSADTTDPSQLLLVANNVMSAIGTGVPFTWVSNQWTLNSCTAHDNGHSSGAVATSSHAPIPGGSTGFPLPPQVAVCISWIISASYRGGKPRWYVPGVSNTATSPAGGSQITSAVASSLQSGAQAMLSAFNGMTAGTSAEALGTISYLQHGSVRPTPLWRPFISARVHERLDSQRRRAGKESAYPSVP